MFLNKINILYERKFGFRPNHSTTHALLEITEKIKQACDSGKYACGVFLGLQKAFGSVNYDILLKKLNHYGIREIANNWFCSFLSDRMHFTSINTSLPDKRELKYGVPQESVLGSLLFILFINDLHNNIEFSTVHHFAEDTNMLLVEKSLKKLKKQINRDLKLVVELISANKLSLNASKTEPVILKSRDKTITKRLKFTKHLRSNT